MLGASDANAGPGFTLKSFCPTAQNGQKDTASILCAWLLDALVTKLEVRPIILGLTPKRQRLEARGDPRSYYHGPIGALSPLAGACGGRYGAEGLVDAAQVPSFL
ncbi:hypothetical protein Holit_02071 [Hollandina sp. SP2]